MSRACPCLDPILRVAGEHRLSYALGHDDTDATAASHRSRRFPRVPRRQRLRLDGERRGIVRRPRCVRVWWRQLHRHGRRVRVVGARAGGGRVRVDHRPVDGVAGAAEPHHRRHQGGPAQRPRRAGTNDNPACGRGVARGLPAGGQVERSLPGPAWFASSRCSRTTTSCTGASTKASSRPCARTSR